MIAELLVRHSVRQGYCASDLDTVGIIDQGRREAVPVSLSLIQTIMFRHRCSRTKQIASEQDATTDNKLFSNNFMIPVCMLYTDCY